MRARFGAVPEALEQRIAAADRVTLDQLLERARTTWRSASRQPSSRPSSRPCARPLSNPARSQLVMYAIARSLSYASISCRNNASCAVGNANSQSMNRLTLHLDVHEHPHVRAVPQPHPHQLVGRPPPQLGLAHDLLQLLVQELRRA